MQIKQINQNQSFGSFFRHSPPCMRYLAQNFYGNNVKFEKAMEILDKRCSKHKFFDMFYSPENNSIKILPKDKSVEDYFLSDSKTYMTFHADEYYAEKSYSEDIKNLKNKPKISFLEKIIDFFSFSKVKKYINISPYNMLPSNVREAVDVIDKMERTIK